MFCIFSLQILNVVNASSLHAFFPPIEHTLLLASVVVVAAAFIRYILDDPRLTRWYLLIGLGTSVICYFVTFQSWTNFMTLHPESEIGLIWCAWVFHLAGSPCNNCDIEILDLLTPKYDAERFGIVLVGSVRHADLILLTKIDLAPYVPFDRDRFMEDLQGVRDDVPVLEVSATRGDGLDTWANWLTELVNPS